MFEFADGNGRVDHEAAAVEPSAHEFVEQIRHVSVPGEQLAENDRVLDRHCGALRVVRRRRVHRVADQHDTAAMPGRRHQQIFERLVDDRVGIAHAVAQRGDLTAISRETRVQERGQFVARHARVARLGRGDEHVHARLAERNEAGAVGAVEGGTPLHFRGLLEGNAPAPLAGEDRPRRVGKQLRAQGRVEAVRADDEVETLAHPVAQLDIDMRAAIFEMHERRAEPDVDAERRRLADEDIVQDRAGDAAIAVERHAFHARQGAFADLLALDVVEALTLIEKAARQTAIDDSDLCVGPQGIRRLNDAHAVDRPVRLYFGDGAMNARTRQRDGGRQAADSAADDQDTADGAHTLTTNVAALSGCAARIARFLRELLLQPSSSGGRAASSNFSCRGNSSGAPHPMG